MAIIRLKPLFDSFGLIYSTLIFWSLTTIMAVLFIPMLSSRFGMFESGIFQSSLFWLSLLQFYGFVSGEFQPILAAVLTLPLFYFLFGMYKSEFASHLLFNASILVSITSLFYLPALFSILLVWIGWLLYNPFSFRTFLLSLIGAMLPFLFAVSIYYLNDELEFLQNIYSLKIKEAFPETNISWYLYIGLIGLFTFAGIFRLFLHGFVKKIGIRKNFTLLILSFVLFAALFLLYKDTAFIAFLLFPASMLINLHFTNINRRRIYEILFIILAGMMFAIPYLPIKP
jgi:hypothetical protein